MKEEIKKNKLLISIIILMILGLVCISVSTKKTDEKRLTYSYKINRDMDYTVELIDNYFYDENILSQKESYASNLVNKVNINYSYKHTGTKPTTYKYHYNITATLKGLYEDKEIWTKKFTLTEMTPLQTIQSTQLIINGATTIDYQYYKNLVNQYTLENNLLLDASLEVNLNIIGENQIEGLEKSKSINDTITTRIALNNLATEVEKISTDTTTDNVFQPTNINNKNILDNILTLCGTICLIGASYLVYLKVKTTNISDKEKYQRNIQRILKSYSELIVTVSNRPNVDSLNHMKLVHIGDLIDAAEQNKVNIIHYETYKNKKSTLYVINGKYVYIYTVTSEDIT